MNKELCQMTYEEKLKYEIEEQKTMREIEENMYIAYINKLKEELSKRS